MPSQRTDQGVNAPRKSHLIRNSILVFIGMLLLFIILFAGIYMFVGNATEEVAKVSDRFVTDLQASNVDDAYGLMSPAAQKATPKDKLQKAFKQVSPVLQGSKKISDRKVSKSNNTEDAIVVYAINSQYGEKYIRVVLQKSGKTWQVLNFRSSDTPLDTSQAN